MKKFFLLVAMLAAICPAKAQTEISGSDSSWKKIYRGSYPKINDLVHTKLDVNFDYVKSWMYGKAWITLKPHFYSTDSLTLDAKGMDIKEVAIAGGNTRSALKYRYNGMQLFITLDKLYNGGENYTIYISYTAKPNELKVEGSAAITDAKGLYFINPTGEDKNKSTQIWTQGETESNSVWMPTIDKPNQKSTEEIYMTVPAKYVTLSNGLLISQKKNTNGTRTDYWKMDLPHAPYLFFMGVGDFAIVKDSYKKMEVNYYVEKKYESVARKIFGNTPEMIGFYEKILGVPYQWPKYDQIVGRDYVSGAMENTTATLHQESAYQNARQLVDGNGWEETIAHELFHHWFGDLVTAESWSNLTLNESFANYSEYLWDEHKYGKDVADEHNLDDMQVYLQSNSDQKSLVRFNYADKEDVFDAVSYNKGGRVLHMLRNYVGDEAFFKALNVYLNNNKFKSGEAAQLRMAFEDVTGKDLHWFWDQWYYGSGQPELKIDYKYDDAQNNAQVIIEQTQKQDNIFRLPISIDIYNGAAKVRYKVWVENRMDTFTFKCSTRPDLINVDADKVLLCKKTDNKTTANFVHQYKYAPNYLDRREALEYFSEKGLNELTMGLKDKFAGLRTLTIENLFSSGFSKVPDVKKSIEAIANNDRNKKTQSTALSFLAAAEDVKYKPVFDKFVNDSSYSVAGAALAGLLGLTPSKSYELSKKYASDAKGTLADVVLSSLIAEGKETDFDLISGMYREEPFSQEKIGAGLGILNFLLNVSDINKIKKGINDVMIVQRNVPAQFKSFTEKAFKKSLESLGKAKGTQVEEYIKTFN